MGALGGVGWIVAALAVVAALIAYPSLRAPLPARAIGFGLFGAVGLLALLAQGLAPVAAVAVTWALLGGGLMLLAATARQWGPILALLGALFASQAVATAHLLLLAVGETIGAIAAPFALFVALALAPLLGASLTRRLATAAAALLGVAALPLVLLIRFGDPASVARPGLSQVLHVADLTSGRFYRATSLAFPDRWTLNALGGGPAETALLPVYDHVFIAPGEPVAVARPSVTRRRLADGRVLLRVAGAAGTREIRLALTASAPIRRAWLNGVPVPLLARPGRIDRIEWAGRDPVVDAADRAGGRAGTVRRAHFVAGRWLAGRRPPAVAAPGDDDAVV